MPVEQIHIKTHTLIPKEQGQTFSKFLLFSFLNIDLKRIYKKIIFIIAAPGLISLIRDSREVNQSMEFFILSLQGSIVGVIFFILLYFISSFRYKLKTWNSQFSFYENKLLVNGQLNFEVLFEDFESVNNFIPGIISIKIKEEAASRLKKRFIDFPVKKNLIDNFPF